MQELFASPSFPWQPDLPDAELHYYPHFWSRKEADALFEQLKNETPWQHDPITVFGKTSKTHAPGHTFGIPNGLKLTPGRPKNEKIIKSVSNLRTLF